MRDAILQLTSEIVHMLTQSTPDITTRPDQGYLGTPYYQQRVPSFACLQNKEIFERTNNIKGKKGLMQILGEGEGRGGREVREHVCQPCMSGWVIPSIMKEQLSIKV